ncbi:MAG: hypothetical protein JWN17_167 [Frankiales bacterium]|nr:hypothetical protein [Frankiales bacterium]
MATSAPVRPGTGTAPSGAATAQRVLLGLAALAVLLQGLWAGIFLRYDGKRDDAESWINVHATGGEVAIALTALAAIIGFWKLRERKDLWGGSAALTVLLVLESYLGGLIKDNGKDQLTAVHVPLAMALMGLSVWLVVRVRQRA